MSLARGSQVPYIVSGAGGYWNLHYLAKDDAGNPPVLHVLRPGELEASLRVLCLGGCAYVLPRSQTRGNVEPGLRLDGKRAVAFEGLRAGHPLEEDFPLLQVGTVRMFLSKLEELDVHIPVGRRV